MGKLHRTMGSGATVMDLPFGGLATTQNHQHERRNIDLCGSIFKYLFSISLCDGSILKGLQQKPIISIRILLLLLLLLSLLLIIKL